jgi:Fe-S cluster assembly protein SufD
MSIERFTGVDGFLARYHGLRARLPGDSAARDAAAEAFQRLGFPGRRDEAWKYTNVRPLAEAAFHERLSTVEDNAHLAGVPRVAESRLVFVDGRYRPDLSDAAPAWFRSFQDEPRFGALARPDRDVMVALNTMLAEDGARLAVPEGVDAGMVQIAAVNRSGGALPSASHPRHVIRLGPRARLTLVETNSGEGAYLHNPVIEIEVADGAVLEHVRLQDEAPAAFHIATVYAEVGAGGTYDCFTLNVGGRLVRTELHTRLGGEGGTVHLNGAQLLRGMQHADFTSVVRHDAPGCGSRQTVKNVLEGRSRGVFQGRIEVARAAQKTDGYQMSQALLLSPDAEVDTKPELEIFADDVKCSHGATVGELDHEQMFYLRSRGVPESEARAILVRAFLAEAVEAIRNEAARAALEGAVEAWWMREAA